MAKVSERHPHRIGAPILVVGCGAMASIFAGRLAASGQDVWMLDEWQAGIKAIQTHGLRWANTDGHPQVSQVRAVSSPDECPTFSHALVLVKSWQTARAAEMLRTCLAADGAALTLQNGLGNDRLLAAQLGEQRTAVGITTLGASLNAAGSARLNGEGRVVLGAHPRLAELQTRLESAGFKVETAEDLRALQWGKLLVNAVINPLTALLEVPNGGLLEIESVQPLIQGVVSEVLAVAGAQSIQLLDGDPLSSVYVVLQTTAANRSSMLADILRAAPTEIDAINGAVAALGRQLQIPAPINETLVQLVKARRDLKIQELQSLNSIEGL